MTPEELGSRHPRLYHVTEPGAWTRIRDLGLLSTSRILDLFEIEGPERVRLERRRRPEAVPLTHPRWGSVVLNDQMPLRETALEACLDDDLTPADWLAMLNARVFFWSDEDGLARMLGARMNRGRPRDVLVFDTLSLARVHGPAMEVCPINSGATIRRPARRGLGTFTPIDEMSYRDWSRRRGGRDRILEVTLKGGARDIADHLVERRQTAPSG
ncbi:DUF7002 family protein [Algihabitans albus]|uniref:DUF7002 family protein n=1 Tax=Algihabitans albus TaxID=2164067 RepID=UPI000E5D6347|nr:hypothetical protein [Algihabitans albus]